MTPRLKQKERRICQELAEVMKFPHWRYQVGGSTAYKNFKLYTCPGRWEQEVVKRDYWWTAGTREGGTFRFFNYLEDALFYAERLLNLTIQVKKPVRGILQQRHAPIAGRDLAEEERQRREDVVLE